MPDNKSVAVYWAIIGLLLLTLAGLVVKFVVLGTTETAAGGREASIL